MTRHYLASLAVAATLAVLLAHGPQAMAQTGAPGTKQMQDTQLKAQQKARGAKKNPHKKADAQKAGSAASASAP